MPEATALNKGMLCRQEVAKNLHGIVSYGDLGISAICLFVCFWRNSLQSSRSSSFTRFLDHTKQRATVGRTPLDEWSARLRDLYLTTHNTLSAINPLNAELNPICHLLALLGGATLVVVSRLRVKTFWIIKYSTIKQLLFYILLKGHHAMILGKWPTWCTNSSLYLFLFITLYMFRAHRAHHQERQIVPIHPLVTFILCWWPKCVQVGRRLLPTCTHLGYQHRMIVTIGCTDTICLSWWWARVLETCREL
jgi:hypothetical protein